MPSSSPEFEYLVATVASILKNEPLPSPPELDWSLWVQMMRFHAVTAFVMANRAAELPALMPADKFAELASNRRLLAMRYLLISQEAGRIQALLRADGIESFFIKGPVIALQAYGDGLKRVYSDLDLVVSRRQLEAAARRLAGIGYLPEPTSKVEPAFDLFSFPPFLDAVHAHGFKNQSSGLSIDLHWQLSVREAHYSCFEGVRDYLGKIELESQVLDCAGPDLQMVISCMSASQSMWRRLVWVLDVASYIRSGVLDPEHCIHIARKLESERHLQLALIVCQRIFDIRSGFPVIDPDFVAAPLVDEIMAWFPRNSLRGGLTRLGVVSIEWQMSTSAAFATLSRSFFRPAISLVARTRWPSQVWFLYRLANPFIDLYGTLKRQSLNLFGKQNG